ncbi:S-adenosyl-L-methionine-dependent methyltransferase [Pleomassaria siparia CBS 279.74]|uniref:S-adenosyl-L-methionine-dependent methyltransferase n=1 Tax=Pleomassaria siparia CBS 279.74 TaxID=1314801 RepID=A0A6G1KAI9_9PLEO|nr:S-adenosyl-L-methionine-dependent methyltransferase [Pleomassaria siparia CBS 279.74]
MSGPPRSDDDSAIEIDPEVLRDDGSSFADFADELNSFTTSCDPSITQFKFENGRRYHAFKSGSYPLPNDDIELERQSVVHFMVKMVLGDKLYLAPSDGFHHVLDLGTGTGCWAIEMGDTHPHAEFLGNDLSPIQPSWVPPNVRFEVDDIENRWAYGAPFDFIFARALACAIGDWPKLIRQAYDNVKPGGWVEFQDFDLEFYAEDGTYSQTSSAALYIRMLMSSARTAGKEPCPGPKLEAWIKNAGFINVSYQKFKLPVGPWPRDQRQKDVGLFNLVQAVDGLEAFSMQLFTSVLKWEPEEVKVLCSKVRAELRSKTSHRILDYHVVYAQRPET